MLDGLKSRRFDLCLAYDLPGEAGVRRESLSDFPLPPYALFSAADPAARRKRASLRDLARKAHGRPEPAGQRRIFRLALRPGERRPAGQASGLLHGRPAGAGFGRAGLFHSQPAVRAGRGFQALCGPVRWRKKTCRPCGFARCARPIRRRRKRRKIFWNSAAAAKTAGAGWRIRPKADRVNFPRKAEKNGPGESGIRRAGRVASRWTTRRFPA